jgi:hypothetical protein
LHTTSAASQTHQTFKIQGMDFLQSHAYVTDVIGTLLAKAERTYEQYPNKPHFFGEMSYHAGGPNKGDEDGVILHNQLWASVHSWDNGTAMTWWWDNWVRPYNLYPHFKMLSQYIRGIDWIREDLKPMQTSMEPHPANKGDLLVAPKLGWAESQAETFTIHDDGNVDNLSQLTEFIHGNYHRNMAPNPIFELTVNEPTTFGFELETIARAGATVEVYLDGDLIESHQFASTNDDYDPGEDGFFEFEIPAGEHQIRVHNAGNDWVKVETFWVENYVQRPVALARGNQDRILVWVYDRPHRYAVIDEYSKYNQLHATDITLPGITSGEYQVEHFDPYTGETLPLDNAVANENGLSFTVPGFLKDTAFRLRKIETSVDFLR